MFFSSAGRSHQTEMGVMSGLRLSQVSKKSEIHNRVANVQRTFINNQQVILSKFHIVMFVSIAFSSCYFISYFIKFSYLQVC